MTRKTTKEEEKELEACNIYKEPEGVRDLSLEMETTPNTGSWLFTIEMF